MCVIGTSLKQFHHKSALPSPTFSPIYSTIYSTLPPYILACHYKSMVHFIASMPLHQNSTEKLRVALDLSLGSFQSLPSRLNHRQCKFHSSKQLNHRMCGRYFDLKCSEMSESVEYMQHFHKGVKEKMKCHSK